MVQVVVESQSCIVTTLTGLVIPETHEAGGSPPRGSHGWIGGLAHELGHAFGLPHPPGCDEGWNGCDADALMWAGYAYDYPDTYLTEADKLTLLGSPFFQYRDESKGTRSKNARRIGDHRPK